MSACECVLCVPPLCISVQYPDAFSADGFFARYPYFLVNLITAVLYGISAVWCSLFMPESLVNALSISVLIS